MLVDVHVLMGVVGGGSHPDDDFDWTFFHGFLKNCDGKDLIVSALRLK